VYERVVDSVSFGIAAVTEWTRLSWLWIKVSFLLRRTHILWLVILKELSLRRFQAIFKELSLRRFQAIFKELSLRRFQARNRTISFCSGFLWSQLRT
jgi:hypothetical protein